MKKIAIIILIAVLTLGALGTAYAAWAQNLFINGTVSSGTYAVSFKSVAPPTASNDTLAGLSAEMATTTVANDTLSITITNAYPGYTTTIPYVIQNTGTVPLSISLSTVSGKNPPNWLTVDNTGAPTTIAQKTTGTGNIMLTCSDSTPQTTGPLTFSYQLATIQSVP
jgi:hypothetical protein